MQLDHTAYIVTTESTPPKDEPEPQSRCAELLDLESQLEITTTTPPKKKDIVERMVTEKEEIIVMPSPP